MARDQQVSPSKPAATPRTGAPAPARGDDPLLDLQDTQGNAALAAQVAQRVAPPPPAPGQDGEGGDPLQRVFGRVAGTGGSFGQAQAQNYLDRGLQFAEGEWFRSQKLSGAAEGLMGQLDADKDGKVSLAEFEGFRGRTLDVLAPGLAPDADEAAVRAAAKRRFAEIDAGRGSAGSVRYDELFGATQAALPQDTEHRDLVAQLGARMALDAVDTDQRAEPVKDRALSAQEWTDAAVALARNRKK